MADNEFRGFEAIADNLLKPEGGVKNEDLDDIPFTDPDDIQDKKKKPLPKPKPEEDEEIEEDEVEETEDVEEEVDEETEEETEEESETETDTEEEVEEIDPKFESDITKFFQQRLSEEFGWEYDDDKSFDSVTEMVEYMGTLVEEASKPKYSNEEVGKIDEFVRNGGKIEDYYKAVSTGSVDPETIDITKESNQRLVVEEHLRTLGYSEERVKRHADRYEDRGVLEEEAEDALELLKEYKEKNKEKLLEEQENEVSRIQEQQQKFISNVEDTIENISDVAGYKLSSKEKKELKEYIFKPTKDGRTQYQIDYSTDQEKNLIESAFFTKNKDALLEKTKKQASTDTLKNMQQKLKSQSKRTKNIGSQDREKGSVQLAKLGQLISKN